MTGDSLKGAHPGADGTPMAETLSWKPTTDEIRGIVAELAPVIDECVRRSRRLLLGGSVPTPPAPATTSPHAA